MIDLFRNARYDFIGLRRWTYTISAVIVLIGLVSLAGQGLRYDIDFTGGVLIQVRFERPPDVTAIRARLEAIGLGDSVIQEYGDAREYLVRARQLTLGGDDMGKRIERTLAADESLGPFELRRAEFVGPQVGRELQRQAVYAVMAGLVGILGYVAIRFDVKGGVAAIIAVLHDVVLCLGAFSLTQREFSVPVLAALLTVVGYSVNDTIVAYDRLRESRNRRKPHGSSFAQEMNEAINQTLSRTVLTSLSTLLPAVTLLLFGGKTLQDFAFVLSIGIVTGTYSTVYIAGAVVVDWTLYVERRLQRAGSAVARVRRGPHHS